MPSPYRSAAERPAPSLKPEPEADALTTAYDARGPSPEELAAEERRLDKWRAVVVAVVVTMLAVLGYVSHSRVHDQGNPDRFSKR